MRRKIGNIGFTIIAIGSVAMAATSIYLGGGNAKAADIQHSKEITESLEFTRSDRNLILSLLQSETSPADQIEKIKHQFTTAWITPTIEIFNFVQYPEVREHLLFQLRHNTGEDYGRDMNSWYRWLWNQPERSVRGYDNFKAEFYDRLDPHFSKYFRDRQQLSHIRLDEIRWGGVRQDGIPPLRRPEMISVAEADYLEDDNIIFGIEINGDVRAYPKRILAWHEMFTDIVGGIDVAGVYCTLCGTVIIYDTDYAGLNHELGTSGFLYRSNKLMYDRQTQSLWNTLKGAPVLGPLVGKDIELNHHSVVTTTWGKWKETHPDTKVLSLNTGHRRDYREGVAYHNYFATDELMFNTPFQDSRLENKREVLALRFKGQAGKSIAIDTKFLNKNPVFQGELGTQKYVVLTDSTGANRVYDPGNNKFTDLKSDAVIDQNGDVWKVTESQLLHPNGTSAKRLPYHRAFWFGWHAAFPNTDLIK